MSGLRGLAMNDELAAIIKRDAETRYCGKCGNRRYPDSDDYHDRTAAECRGGKCLSPEDHHPFVDGDIPPYEQAARDRRYLLALLGRPAVPPDLTRCKHPRQNRRTNTDGIKTCGACLQTL